MNRLLFLIGALITTYSLLTWLLFSPDDLLYLTRQELTSLSIIGCLLMLPETAYQLRQFFSSKSRLDD